MADAVWPPELPPPHVRTLSEAPQSIVRRPKTSIGPDKERGHGRMHLAYAASGYWISARLTLTIPPMKIMSGDARCRYRASFGTQDQKTSPFGQFLLSLDVHLPKGLGLDTLVQRGWIKPVLHVPLPREAFESWNNFPQIIDISGNCPTDQQWAIQAYLHAMSGMTIKTENWWLYDLDDPAHRMFQLVRDHAGKVTADGAFPAPFQHQPSGQIISPWIDYFAYWQAFQVAEYVDSMCMTLAHTSELPTDLDKFEKWRRADIENVHRWLDKRWGPRVRAFDWLSRMRTALALSIFPNNRSFDDQRTAIASIASDAGLTIEEMKADIRDVLLVMWREWSSEAHLRRTSSTKLRKLLRQEIEYAISFVQRISGTEIDFLDEFWSPERPRGLASRLIDAFPREEELARMDFGMNAEPYLRSVKQTIPAIAAMNEAALRTLLDKYWFSSRAVRRFVLAFHRFHVELRGQHLEEIDVIRQAERIEQFNLIMLHAERVLSLRHRDRTKQTSFPDVRGLAKDGINLLICKWGLTAGGFSATLHGKLKPLWERTQLHKLDESAGLPIVSAVDIQSGDAVGDHLAAAFVNFVIARKYAAHHDALDVDLVYPSSNTANPGGTLLESVLFCVVSVLLVD